MWDRMILAALFVAMALAGTPAQACITSVPIELADVEYADAVVVGRIDDYKIVPGLISEYSRFDVLVDEVLIGKVPQTLAVDLGQLDVCGTRHNAVWAVPDCFARSKVQHAACPLERHHLSQS